MMQRPGLVHRIQRVETRRSHVEVAEFARRLAEHDDLPVTEIIVEAERIADVCHQQGIMSTEGMVRYVATELGITAAELEVEMTRYREVLA